MDLKHDWKSLNEVLFLQSGPERNSPTLLLLEKDPQALSGWATTGEVVDVQWDPGYWNQKRQMDQLAQTYHCTQTIVVQKQALDGAIAECTSFGSNYYLQLELLRKRLQTEEGEHSSFFLSRKHFILNFFGGLVHHILPKSFNVLLLIDQRPAHQYPQESAFDCRALVLTYIQGELDQFFEPDFSTLHVHRLMNWKTENEAIGSYLENRYLLPCYGLFFFQEDWEKCVSQTQHKPWLLFTELLRQGRSEYFPHYWLPKAFLATQRILLYLREQRKKFFP